LIAVAAPAQMQPVQPVVARLLLWAIHPPNPSCSDDLLAAQRLAATPMWDKTIISVLPPLRHRHDGHAIWLYS